VYNTIAIEDAGVPAVMLTNQDFVVDSGSAASGKGMPGVRVLFVPSTPGRTLTEEVDAGITPLMYDIIGALTRPLTAEEKSPKKKVEELSRIIFRGNLEEVNRFFYRRGWGDGLPIIPPTEEAVAEMLTGTDLPADHVVTRILPRLGKATVEKIAINAVMAGALPTYMPVLIAGVQALMEPVSRFDSMQTVMEPASRFDSAHDNLGSWPPFWIINGPMRNDIRVNCGVGALSPGDIANATIGRAMGLIIKNIGGVRKGIEDVGVLGNPGKYSLVIGEYEEESPWEPLHVERGFKKEDSTVTLSFPRTLADTFGRSFRAGAAGAMGATGAKRILDSMTDGIQGANFACFVLGPLTARILSTEGWTKKKIKDFVSENAGVVARPAAVPGRHSTTHQRPALTSDGIMIIVAGALTASIHLLPGERIVPWHNFVTKKIELPANWGKLVAKYKNLVPTYAKY
jgi:hypothetical protein